MTLLIKDRVKEISTTVGVGPILVGTTPVVGFTTIDAAIANGNTTPYVIEHQSDGSYEIGVGQYYSSNTSLVRLQVLASNNSNQLVSFAAGNKNIFVTIPAAYSAMVVRDLSQFAVTTSANLASIISDETGVGPLVFANNATLFNPTITGNTAQFTDTTNATNYSTAPATFSGGVGVAKDVYVGGTLSVSGNVYINGNTISISANNLDINDSLIYMAQGNPANLNDIGIVGHFNNGTYQHTGLVRDHSDGVWKLFSGVTTEPTGNIISLSSATYDTLKVGSIISNTFTSLITTGVAPLVINSTTPVANLSIYANNISGSIVNSSLANTSVTINTGAGLSGGGSVALGSSVSVSANTGNTTQAGIVQLNDSVISISTVLAATANAVYTAYNFAVTANTNAANASYLTTGTVPNVRLSSIPNSSLANNSITIGSTVIQLGSSNTTLSGLNLLSSNTFIANNGFYSSNNYTGSYSHGIVVDYVPGTGRISVGSADGITIYNGGVGTTPLVSVTAGGVVTSNVYTSSAVTGIAPLVINSTTPVANLTANLALGVAGGSANNLLYQTAANITSYITAPAANNTYLKWNTAGGFSWATVTGGGGLTTTDDNATNATYYPVFVTAAGGSTAKTASTDLTFNPSSGTLSATLFQSLSDKSKKINIIGISGAINTVKKLNGVEFDWIDNGFHSSGVIAQEIEQILPHLVQETDGIKSVNYSGLIGYLIEAIKDLSDKIDNLENK